jgi:hypothetical protein
MDEEIVCPYKKAQEIDSNKELAKYPYNNDEDSDKENVSTSGCPFVDNSIYP